MSDLADRIKNIRLSLGETMEEFGKRFNTSKATINNWEKGRNKPNKNNLLLIANLGGISLDELLNGNSQYKFMSFLHQQLEENFNSDLRLKEIFTSTSSHQKLFKIYKTLIENQEYTQEIAFVSYNKALHYTLSIELSYPIDIFTFDMQQTINTVSKIWNLFEDEDKDILIKIINDIETLINNYVYSERNEKIHFSFNDDYSELKINLNEDNNSN